MAYNDYLNKYDKSIGRYDRYLNNYDNYFKPFKIYNRFDNLYDSAHADTDTINAFRKSFSSGYLKFDNKRSLLDRGFDALLMPLYTTAGFVRGFVDKDITPTEGFLSGLRASNPFGKGYEKGETTYSNVLEEIGWKPQSTIGKVARGAVGFTLDVLLDPVTYLSGGLSAVVKGTGKVGVGLTHASASKKIADKYGVNILNGLNVGDAKKIITQNMIEKNVGKSAGERVVLSSDEIEEGAKLLSDKYNKLIGLQPEVRDLTIGLGNAPFGHKIFGKYADKSYTLAKSDTLQKIGDRTFAPYYAKLRDSIYGSKVGELFSTKMPLYQLSKTNPAGVYEFIRFVDKKMGLDANKRLAEKEIFEKAKELDLSPSDTKKILELMQDKTVWRRATEAFNYLDTKEGKFYFSQLAQKNRIIKSQIKSLKELRGKLEHPLSREIDSVEEGKEAVKKLEKGFRESLHNLKIKHIDDVKDLEDVTKLIHDDIEILKGKTIYDTEKIKNFDKNIETLNKEIPETIKRIDELKKEANPYVKQLIKMVQKQDTDSIEAMILREKITSISDEIKRLKVEPNPVEIHKNIIDSFDEFIKVKEKYKSNKALDIKTEGLPNIGSFKVKLIEDISNHLTGNPHFISLSTWDNNIEMLVDLMKQGSSKEDIIKFIEKNVDNFNGISPTIYSFVAEKLKYGTNGRYKNWEETFVKRMKILSEAIQKNGKLSPAQKKVLAELYQLQHIRQYWLDKFRGKSQKEIMKIITEEANKDLDKIWKEFKGDRRTRFNGASVFDDDIEKIKALINESAWVDDYKDLRYKLSEHAEIKPLEKVKITSEEQTMIVNDLIDFIKSKGAKNITKAHNRWINKVSLEFEFILKNVFKKNYSSLSLAQKDLARSLAIKNSSTAHSVKNQHLKIAVDEVKNRLEKARVKEIKKTIVKGIDVDVKKGDEVIKGTVVEIVPSLDGNIYYKVSDVGNIKPEDVVNIYKDSSPKTIEELMVKSDITNYVVSRIDDLTEELQELQVKVKNIEIKQQEKFAELSTKKKTTDAELNEVKRQLKNQRSRLKYAETRKKEKIEANIKALEAKYKELEEVNIKHSIVDEAHQNKVDRLTANYVQNATEMKSTIVKSEKVVQKIRERLATTGEDLDALIKEAEEIQEILSNRDAFDSYYRILLGDEQVDDVIVKEFDDIVGIALKDHVDVNDTVREIAVFLRNRFAEIGREEVSIRKLTPEQFEGLMMEYLPHIPTLEGEKFFAKQDVKKTIENFGDDYGSGRVFNPHAKSRTLVLPDGEGNLIHNPTIEQINEFFSEKLKGKNVFSEFISDIWLARMLKHTELMYDDKLMRTMLEEFGTDIKFDYHGLSLDAGNKVVMNYGMLRETVKTFASIRTNLDMSYNISEHLRSVIKDINSKAKAMVKVSDFADYKNAYRLALNTCFKEEIDKFVRVNYSDTVREKNYLKALNTITDELSVTKNLDDFAMPMVELDEKQIASLQSFYDSITEEYLTSVKKNVLSLQKSLMDYPDETIIQDLTIKINKMNFNELKEYTSKITADFGDIATKERIERIMNKFDKLEWFKPPQIKQVHETIVNKVNQARKVQIAKDQNNLLQLADKLTHLIKLNQTTVIPAFHMRNKFSNTFNNWITIGQDAVNFKMQKNSFLAMRYAGDEKKLGGIMLNDKYSWSDIYREAVNHGVIDEGFFAKDLGVGVNTRGIINRLPPHLDPTDTKNFVWYKKGAEFGSLIENQDRLLHFASCVKNGKSFREAAESSIHALFDYSDLTVFEMQVMKRILPYYTWLRKNSMLQLEMMLEQPKRYLYTSKVMGGVEGMVNEEDTINSAFVNDFAKDWVQTPFEVKNPQGRTEYVLWNPNLPFMDLGRIPDPFNLKGSLSEMFVQTNPLLKIPIEQAVNRNFFFDSPIVGEEQNQITRRADHVLSNYAPYGVAKGLATKRGTDFNLHLFNNLSGIKFLSYDYDSYKAAKLDELRKQYGGGLQGQVERASEKSIKGFLGYQYDEAIVRKLNSLSK